jgi:AGCS family alanine or glycine:cation symporter
MEEIIGVLNGIVWSNALIVLCLGTGLYFFHQNSFFAGASYQRNVRYLMVKVQSRVCLLFKH